MEFPPPQHLLDEILDLEGDQDNLAPDAPGESSTTFKGKDVPKKKINLYLLLARKRACPFRKLFS